MEEQGFLIGYAQLALVLAGFISIFLVAATRDGKLSKPDSIHFATMTLASMLSVVSGLLPILFHHVGLAGDLVWRSSSVLAIAFAGLFMIFITVKLFRLAPAERREVGYLHMTMSYALGFATGGFWLASILGHAPQGSYIVGLVLGFCVGVLGFFTFALQKFVLKG